MKTELENREEQSAENEENEGRYAAQNDEGAANGEDQPIEDEEAKKHREEEN